MKIYIGKGRCANCLTNKKVVKIGSYDAKQALCKKCLKVLSESREL